MDQPHSKAEDGSTCGASGTGVEHSHPMYFSFTTNAIILWPGWTIGTQTGLIMAALLGLALTLLLEVLKCYIFNMQLKRDPAKSLGLQVSLSFLHMVHVLTGYILMLTAMTFNVWILTSIVLGSGFGYFIIRGVLLRAAERRFKRKLGEKRLLASLPPPQPRPCTCAKTRVARAGECKKERWLADDPVLKSLRASADGKETAV